MFKVGKNVRNNFVERIEGDVIVRAFSQLQWRFANNQLLDLVNILEWSLWQNDV